MLAKLLIADMEIRGPSPPHQLLKRIEICKQDCEAKDCSTLKQLKKALTFFDICERYPGEPLTNYCIYCFSLGFIFWNSNSELCRNTLRLSAEKSVKRIAALEEKDSSLLKVYRYLSLLKRYVFMVSLILCS